MRSGSALLVQFPIAEIDDQVRADCAEIEDVDGKNIGDVVRNEFRGDAADVAEHDEQDERQAHAARRGGTVVVYN